MRALRSDSLSLFLYHQLRSRIGVGDTEPADWDDDRVVQMLVIVLNEIPGIQARAADGQEAALLVQLAGSADSRVIPVRHIVDALRLVWREFHESRGDH